jgi:multimeric flavodoxin WrbA
MDCRKTGKCEEIQDDVFMLAEKVADADVIIVSTPIYGNHLPGQFKMLFDRITGLTHKSEMREGKFTSVSRLPIKKRSLGLIAVAGSPFTESCDQALRFLGRVFLPELNDGVTLELRATGINGLKQISMNTEALTDYVRALRYPNVEEAVEKMLLQNDEYLKHAFKTGKELISSLKNS